MIEIFGSSKLHNLINQHDRIIMLGHGSKDGLFAINSIEKGTNRLIVSSKLVCLLRQKQLIGIWCDADEFFRKYSLHGVCTGMIISELEEAYLYCIKCSSENLTKSNEAFSNALGNSINNDDMISKVKCLYNSGKFENNNIVTFNENNIFYY